MTQMFLIIIGVFWGLTILHLIRSFKNNFGPKVKKYLIEARHPTKQGDLVKSDNPACYVTAPMLVLEENIWGPRFHDGLYCKGFLVLADNKKMFISMEDCYQVVETN